MCIRDSSSDPRNIPTLTTEPAPINTKQSVAINSAAVSRHAPGLLRSSGDNVINVYLLRGYPSLNPTDIKDNIVFLYITKVKRSMVTKLSVCLHFQAFPSLVFDYAKYFL